MSYYNQNNYGSIPYPSQEAPKATVKSGGCGVCCASMIVTELTKHLFDPVQCASYSMKNGARVNGGTDVVRLGKAIAKDFGLEFSTTNDIKALTAFLRNGGAAICNVGGNYPGHVGLFSDGGHFIVARGMYGNKITIWDSGYYTGKFNKEGRKGKVIISGNNIYVDPAELDKDCKTRNPRYYLFKEDDMSKFKDVNGHYAQKHIEKLEDYGIVNGDGTGSFNPDKPISRADAAIMIANALTVMGK